MKWVKRIFIIAGKIIICILLYGLNVHLLWNYSGIRKKQPIENEGQVFFQVVIVTSQGAELFLDREEFSAFTQKQKDWTYLIPVGQVKQIEEQIQNSYRRKYNGDSMPYLKVDPLDAERQMVELYLSGDPRDVTLWYEATDKKIVPKYQLIFGAFHWLPFGLLAIGLVVAEYKIGKRVFEKLRNRKLAMATQEIT